MDNFNITHKISIDTALPDNLGDDYIRLESLQGDFIIYYKDLTDDEKVIYDSFLDKFINTSSIHIEDVSEPITYYVATYKIQQQSETILNYHKLDDDYKSTLTDIQNLLSSN